MYAKCKLSTVTHNILKVAQYFIKKIIYFISLLVMESGKSKPSTNKQKECIFTALVSNSENTKKWQKMTTDTFAK